MKNNFLGFLITKMLLSSAVLAIPANPCSPWDPRCGEIKTPPFQGFFLGLNVGHGMGVHRKTHQCGIISQRISFGTKGIDGGINIGYSHQFGNFGIGLEGIFNITNVSGYKNSNIGNISSLVEKAKLNNSLQIRGNIFYVLNDFIAPKVILGLDSSIWKRTFESPYQDIAKKHRHNSFVGGIGIDFKLCQHFITGFEYTASICKTNGVSINDSDVSGFRPHYRKVAVTFKFIY